MRYATPFVILLMLLVFPVAEGEMKCLERPDNVESYVYMYGHLLVGDLQITCDGESLANPDTVRINGWPIFPRRRHDERIELVSDGFIPRAYLLPSGAKPRDVKQIAYDLAREFGGSKQDQLEEMKAYFDELVTEGILTSTQIYPGEIEITWAHNNLTDHLGPPSNGKPRCDRRADTLKHVLDDLEKVVNNGGVFVLGERYKNTTGLLFTSKFLVCLEKVKGGEGLTWKDVDNTSFKNPRFLADMRRVNGWRR